VKVKIAIVGAGMSGLAAAQSLVEADAEVVVVEKSCDIGGRLATRRRGDTAWNHGAPEAEASDPDFVHFLLQQARSGHAAHVPSDSGNDRFVGVPDMRGLLRGVARALDIRFNCEITRLGSAQGWFLETTDNVRLGPFDSVLTTIPAPQLVQLLLRSKWPISGDLTAVSMDPCWTLLLGFNENPDPSLSEWAPPATIVQRITFNRSSETGQTAVLHTTARWSRRWLDLEPEHSSQQLSQDLSEEAAFKQLLRSAVSIQAHRWRYAFADKTLGRSHIWNPDTRLGHAGDWCLGRGAQDAYRSGVELARAVVSNSDAGHLAGDNANA
jgi:predicted NAD/FAD-dependent oxidoreductase